MELQVGSPSLVESLYAAGSADAPVAAVKDVGTKSARIPPSRLTVRPVAEEAIVPDQRSGLTPAQSVERKLSTMLRGGAAIPVSHFRLARLCRKG
ncbi:MAG TPA: hypothetical protein VH120_10440 [Gemmataceae bacterium]|jgi:hypothetical protein|nr:hypothetical protein [Gemmataceae bacterium]